MQITDAPALITTPFAQNGTRNDIPAAGDGLDAGRASFATGFPDETMKPITAGGVPPFGADFNGILYALTNAARFYGAGGHYKFNADFAAKIGGYPMGATVQATDNMGHWLNVVEANSANPESALSTGWLPLADHNGTATVNLTASTALTPLQAAKANLRFTGTPAGNVTVTFPAWTKRYSIINDCAGDGSVICTTGHEGSISIKNGARYEIGCDGRNLTVATINASQAFAEPNKNVSSLDAPTVQQIINALGSAAAHQASDFDDKGSADAVRESLIKLDESLSKIAKTGVITDAINSLPWSRIGEKPSVLNNIYNGNGDTVITSSSGAGKFTVSDEWINFYPKGKGSCFSVGPDGRIYNASINHDQVLGLHKVSVSGNYGDLNDKPVLADSTNKPMRYGADVPSYTDLKYEDDRIPSVSIVAQLRDGLINVINKIRDSLSKVATSGDYNDLTNKPFIGDAAVKGVIYGTQDPNDAGWDDGKVASGAYIKRVMQYYLETYAIGSYMYCQPVSNTNELVPGDIVDGQYLRPSSGNKVGGLGGLPGQWKCKGYSVNSGVAALERVTLFQRFS